MPFAIRELTKFITPIRVASLVLIVSQGASAAIWIEPGDRQLRHHIQLLADTGVISVPVTTWPLMWSGIAQDLRSVDKDVLTALQLGSYNYVISAYERAAAAETRFEAVAYGRDYANYFKGFDDSPRERAGLELGAEGGQGRFTWKVQTAYVGAPQDDDEVRLDGSYLAGTWGNWVLSAGAVDRWWGPGWQDSLVLSNNARPVPGVALQRNRSDPFESRWLSWIGPWQLSLNAGQMESERAISRAKLLGLRFSLRPVSSLEIGLTRTAQWGGEGRPQSLDTLLKLLFGNDNLDKEMAPDGTYSSNEEPGNQLGGIDWRWSFEVAEIPGSFYGQVIGEDEAGKLPADTFFQLGVDGAFSFRNTHNRLRLEYTDTVNSSPDLNVTYEHGIYLSGYRYKGRPLGAGFDNDTRAITLAADHYLDDGYEVAWRASHLQLNRDGTNVPNPGGNILSATEQTLWYLNLSVSRQFERLWLTAGLDYLSEPLQVHGQQIGRLTPTLEVGYRF